MVKGIVRLSRRWLELREKAREVHGSCIQGLISERDFPVMCWRNLCREEDL